MRIFGDSRFNREAIALSLPIMFQCLITTAINTIDTFMMGSFSDEAIAAVSTVSRYPLLVNTATVGSIVAGCCIYLAQYYGAERYEKTREVFRIAIVMTCIVILPFFMTALFFPSFIIRLFNKSDAVLTYALPYLGLIRFAELFLSFSIIFSNSLHAIGNARTPMRINLITVLLKVGLNYLFLFVMDLGIIGAGLSTLISRFAELMLYLYVLRNNDYCFMTEIRDIFRFEKDDVVKILKTAIPFTINNFLYVLGVSLFFTLYSVAGEVAYNSYVVAGSFNDVFMALDSGLFSAFSIIVSQALGSGDLDKALEKAHYTFGLSLILGIVFAVAEFASALLIPVVYSGSSQAVIRGGMSVLRLQSLIIVIYILSMNNYAIFKAGGDMTSIFIMDSGIVWLVQLPLTAYLAYRPGTPVLYLYLGFIIGELVKIIIAFILFRKKRWLVSLVD